MKIGIIDNFDSFVYNLVRYVRELEGIEVVVQRNNQINYAVLDSCDALLLSPGPGIPSEAGELLNIIRRYSGKKKILGVCLGHQAIAEAFGGTLQKCVKPLHGKGSTMYIEKTDYLFFGLDKELEVGRYHSWEVDLKDAKELESIASSEGVVMALRHKKHPTTGVQFHPESILTPKGRHMIANWISSN